MGVLAALIDLRADQPVTARELARRKALKRLRELGSSYRHRGELSARVKQALKSGPGAAIERALTVRIQKTMSSG